jgi:hypothetical protein
MVKSQKLTFSCMAATVREPNGVTIQAGGITLAKYKRRKRDYIAAGAGMRDSEGICGGLGSAISVYSTGH